MNRLSSDGPPSVRTRRRPRRSSRSSIAAGSTRSDRVPDASITSASAPNRCRRFGRGLAAGQDQRRHFGAGEQLGVVLEVGAVGDDGDGRYLGLTAALPVLALRRGHLRAGVVLDPHGGRADDDDVGFLAHPAEQRAVARAGQAAGLAVVGGAAVEARDHVGPHPAARRGCRGRRRTPRAARRRCRTASTAAQLCELGRRVGIRHGHNCSTSIRCVHALGPAVSRI